MKRFTRTTRKSSTGEEVVIIALWEIIYYTFLQTLRLHTRVISKINGEKYSTDISQQFMRGCFNFLY